MVVPDDADMCDVQHGATYKQHLVEMKQIYETWKSHDGPDGNLNDYINVNFLLSLFYDGIKVYEWKHSSFWPLIISILNLPPSYRSKFGVGQFIIGLLTVAKGGAGESLLLHCLIDELLLLNKGIPIVTRKGKKYFLCVRLIQYLLDTPAASKFFCYEGHNSLAGCVYCGRISGKSIKALDKTVYIGHRFLLPLDHYLRIFGQTGTCCPRHFYPQRLVNQRHSLEIDLLSNDLNAVALEDLPIFENNPNSAVVQLKIAALR